MNTLQATSSAGPANSSKRRLFAEEETPRSKHIDKKIFVREAVTVAGSGARAFRSLSSDSDSLLRRQPDTLRDDSPGPEVQSSGATERSVLRGVDNSVDRDEGFARSHAGVEHLEPSSASPSRVEARKQTDTPQLLDLPGASSEEGMQDEQNPSTISTPRASRGDQAVSIQSLTRSRQSNDSTRSTRPQVDLLSFQTPAPPSRMLHASASHVTTATRPLQLERLRNDQGEEFLLDITPRVYSPQSIPLYTLRDLDALKAEFAGLRRDLEVRVQSLEDDLARAISHADHHAALAAQGESLHAEYSKKHVKKVTALKKEWESRMNERLAAKDLTIAEGSAKAAELEELLAAERREKREVIAMTEELLGMVGDRSDKDGLP